MRMKRITALLAAAMLTTAAAQADWTCPDPACGKTWGDTVTICNECGYEAPMHGLSVPVVGSDFVRLQWYGYASATDVYYRPRGSESWLDGGTTDRNSIKLSGLTPCTTYEVLLYNENGDQLSDSFYFPSDTFAVRDYVTANGGTYTVYWDDPDNNGPYKVSVIPAGPQGINQYPLWARWSLQNSTVEGTSIDAFKMLPGSTYEIRVEDRTGKEAARQVMVPTLDTLGDQLPQNVRCEVKPEQKDSGAANDTAIELTAFSAADVIANMDTKQYGFFFWLSFDMISDTQPDMLQVFVIAPNGFIYGLGHWEFTIKANNYGWDFLSCYGLKACYLYNGTIPVGTWGIQTYVNGVLVVSNSFEVVE